MLLAKAGRFEVLLLDKSTYPRLKVCGSGLSPYGLNLLATLGLKEKFRPRHVPVVGVTGRGPGGGTVHLRGETAAWVVPRVEFDHGLVVEAERHGARFIQGTKVTDLLRDPAGEVLGVRTTEDEIEADLVVCANGSPSRFEADQTPRDGIRTIMGWWVGASGYVKDETIMVWDRRLDGYYAWLFPEPDDKVNIGLTIPERAPDASRLKAVFQEILDEHFGENLRNADRVGKWMGHPATVTTRVGPIAQPRAMWVGEAARLVCPGTVEGIAFAIHSSMLAAKAIERGLDPARGLSGLQQALFRTQVALQLLPKFWAGEGFTRAMRSDRVRALSQVVNPTGLARRATSLLGVRR